ncbi:MAG: hypothetical protein RLZZ354_490 [Pseudomonadota bacterium]|jgi:hypothetical protein
MNERIYYESKYRYLLNELENSLKFENVYNDESNKLVRVYILSIGCCVHISNEYFFLSIIPF